MTLHLAVRLCPVVAHYGVARVAAGIQGGFQDLPAVVVVKMVPEFTEVCIAQDTLLAIVHVA